MHGLMMASLGGQLVVDGVEGNGSGVVCFEKAVVMSRLGGMEGKKRPGVFEMLTCKAWKLCGVNTRGKGWL